MKKFYTVLLPLIAIFSTTSAFAATVVTPPAGLSTEKYFWTGDAETSDHKPYTIDRFIKIGFDGNDVYVQGLCADLPNAWVKGTVDGTTATFATGQYFGVDNRFAAYGLVFHHYFMGQNGSSTCDVVFTYDTETKNFSTDTWWVDNELPNTIDDYYVYITYKSSQWTFYKESSGKPTNPAFNSVAVSDTNYPNIKLDISIYDTNGVVMDTDKLYYRIFSDIEHTIEPVVFSPDKYADLTETITEIPYNMDNRDIYSGGSVVYLNQSNVGEFNRIGVQVVYYGGKGNDASAFAPKDVADNESELVWYFIKDYAGAELIGADSAKPSGIRYNALGIRVDENYKGLVIEDGKKIIVR